MCMLIFFSHIQHIYRIDKQALFSAPLAPIPAAISLCLLGDCAAGLVLYALHSTVWWAFETHLYEVLLSETLTEGVCSC